MIEQKLEIVIITYNRAQFLQKTLEQLLLSPFADCCITVLDNCSTDNTREISLQMGVAFSNFSVITNRVNIGGNPNYLKAIEISSSEYTWVLCDDDDLNFSTCDDSIDAILSGEYEIIEVGAPEQGTWPRGRGIKVRQMLDEGLDYYSRMSFFPAYIFRTNLFDSFCFCWGYKHINNLYPQFAFLNKSVQEDFSVYLANKKIVTRNEPEGNSFFPLAWYASWVACCKSISDKKLRYQVIEEATIDRGFFKGLCFWTILDKKCNNDGMFILRVLSILLAFNGRQRIKYLLVLPISLLPLPLSFWVWVRLMLYRLMCVPDNEIPPLEFIERG